MFLLQLIYFLYLINSYLMDKQSFVGLTQGGKCQWTFW